MKTRSVRRSLGIYTFGGTGFGNDGIRSLSQSFLRRPADRQWQLVYEEIDARDSIWTITTLHSRKRLGYI